jgi:hypothetical protein
MGKVESKLAEDHTRHSEMVRILISLFAAPSAWLVQFQINYSLVGWSCATGRHFVLYVVSSAALVVALTATFIAWTGRRDSGANERNCFIFTLGVLVSTMSSLLIVAQGIAEFVFNACQR